MKVFFASTVVALGAALETGSSSSIRRKPVYLGVDVGTQGTKILAHCPEEGRVVARAQRSYGLLPTTVAGRAEQHPDTWMAAIEECLEDIGGSLDGYTVRGLGVSGQQHGMVALDEHRRPLRPAKLWCDVEATDETEALQQKNADDLSFLTPGFTSPKILWMKANELDLFGQAKWFVLPHDYATMELAGLEEPTTDAGDASGNGFLDASTRTNRKDLADAVDPGLFGKLPRIMGPGELVGHLAERFAKKLGISPSADPVPLSVGSGDNMCSALGVGCVSPGQAVLSLGTSGTLFGVSETPVPTNTPLAPFCDATGRHLPLACTMSCTGVLTRVLEDWCPPDWTHEVAAERAAAVEAGCYGITFLPYLGGERTPNWPHATGALLGLTPANIQHARDPAVLYRACLEGITFVLVDALRWFPEPIDTLLVVGGGAKNHLWQQIIADAMNCKLVFPLESESAALGAAFQAGAAATGSTVEDYVRKQAIEMGPTVVEPKNPEAYVEAFQRYKSFGEALYGQNQSS